jgi:deoxyadenosine/deoxycytidine kinase
MKNTKLIAVEGPIGVGKTTFARMLSEKLKARLILEPVEENPFLELFYKDPRKWAFQTQLQFLFSRYQQFDEIKQQDLFSSTTICDYIFEKDKIFAYMNLTDKELALYEKIFKLLNPDPVKPDLVIYLQARLDILVSRIRKRDRTYERPLKTAYLEKLVESYNEFFFRWKETPLLVINTSDIDFVKRKQDLDDLVEVIGRMKQGTEHFHLVSGR